VKVVEALGQAGLEDEVAEALRASGVEVAEVLNITGLPEPAGQRGTHRVTLAGGHTFKVRRVRRPEKASRMDELLRTLGDPHFPRPLWVSGRVVLEPWVDGLPLSGLPMTEQRIAAAAEVLGRLHSLPRLGRRRLPERATSHRPFARARRQVARLASAGFIDRDSAASLIQILVRCAPTTALVGVTHRDFCASNLVEDYEGQIIAVDNENMRVGFLDDDVARTWYRWPMASSAWRSFVSAYEQASGRQVAANSWPFWQICAVATSAWLRLVHGMRGLETPLVVLRSLIA
jgi:Ser/Thr protein kinase RdoA (MazF antagonist)